MDCGFAEQVVVHRDSLTCLSDWFVDSAVPTDVTVSDAAAVEAIKSNPPGFVDLKRLPFEVVFQNDILPAAKKLAELNGWAHNFSLRDIRLILDDPKTVLPEADVVIGGFPCQDFSHAGKRQGFDSDRGTLYRAYVEVVRRVKPKVFVAENVQGLLTMEGNPIQTIIGDFSAVGYTVKYQLVKCEEFGIPQTRHRVIIIGVRSDLISATVAPSEVTPSVAPPEPAQSTAPSEYFTGEWNMITENKVRCSIDRYFRHLEEPDRSPDYAQQSYSKAKRLQKGQGQSAIRMDGFAPTMRAEHHGNIEFRRIKQNASNATTDSNVSNVSPATTDTTDSTSESAKIERRLTVREAALIQTFPPGCRLTDKPKPNSMAYKPIGNAVPPFLGYLVARKVHDILQHIVM